MGIVSVFHWTRGSWLEAFFRWVYLGGLLDFVYAHYTTIMTALALLFLARWIRDWRWLAGIGLAIWLFFTFGF